MQVLRLRREVVSARGDGRVLRDITSATSTPASSVAADPLRLPRATSAGTVRKKAPSGSAGNAQSDARADSDRPVEPAKPLSKEDVEELGKVCGVVVRVRGGCGRGEEM